MDKIFVLHHSAIQQIDKQQIADKQKGRNIRNNNKYIRNRKCRIKIDHR